MKKVILVLFTTAIAFVSSSNAQEKKATSKTPEQRTEKIVSKLNEVLALNEDQKGKVKDVILKREQQRAELHKKFEKDKEGLKEANQKNMKAAEEELRKILSPEQIEKLKKHREEMKQKHKDKKGASASPDDDQD
jgi:hypothetical protein